MSIASISPDGIEDLEQQVTENTDKIEQNKGFSALNFEVIKKNTELIGENTMGIETNSDAISGAMASISANEEKV